MRYNSKRPAANMKQPPSLVCNDLNIDERLRTSSCSSQQKQNDHAFFAIGVIGFFFFDSLIIFITSVVRFYCIEC